MKRTITQISALLFATVLPASATLIGESFRFTGGPQGNTYIVYIEQDGQDIDWEFANQFANNLGPYNHLATLTSQAENDFVFDTIIANGFEGVFEAWIGGVQAPYAAGQGSGDDWSWVNGEGAIPGTNAGPGYANWLDDEPNDYSGPGSEQHLAIGLRSAGDPQNGWNDEGTGGFNIQGFIVECEHVPDTGSSALLLALGLVGCLTGAGKLRRKA